MTQKTRQDQLFSGPVTMLDSVSLETLSPTTDGVSSGGTLTPNTLVTLTSDVVRYTRHAKLTLASLVVAVAEADDFGGTKICDLPDSNVLVIGCEVDLTLVKGGETGGLETATDITFGIGSAVASNSTLSATMIDVLTGTHTADEDPAVWADHTNAQTTPAIAFIDDSATGALYLNAAAAITADDTLTVSGTVDLYYIDTGNVTS